MSGKKIGKTSIIDENPFDKYWPELNCLLPFAQCNSAHLYVLYFVVLIFNLKRLCTAFYLSTNKIETNKSTAMLFLSPPRTMYGFSLYNTNNNRLQSYFQVFTGTYPIGTIGKVGHRIFSSHTQKYRAFGGKCLNFCEKSSIFTINQRSRRLFLSFVRFMLKFV